MNTYVVGSNIPGFTPDNDPDECCDLQEAKGILMAEIEFNLECAADETIFKLSPAASIDTAYLNLVDCIGAMVDRSLKTHNAASITVMGRVFWISPLN
jgi:hypothetical protein